VQTRREQVRHFILENFLAGEDRNLKDEDSFLGLGIIDSTGVLELIAFVEQQFEVTIDDAEVIPENLDSIQNLAIFIERKKVQLPTE
jgi:acyl carrier protein